MRGFVHVARGALAYALPGCVTPARSVWFCPASTAAMFGYDAGNAVGGHLLDARMLNTVMVLLAAGPAPP
jgi:hypothetical protein